MANNNNLIFNAALAGAIEGTAFGRILTNATAGSYAAQVAACAALATEIDAQIPNDGTISGGGGVTLPPTTAAITGAQAVKTGLIRGIAAAVTSGRNLTDATAGDYATLAAAAAALYTEGVASAAVG